MDWLFLNDGRGSVRRLSNTGEWDLPEAYDGNYGTATGLFWFRDDKWLYVGHDTRYSGIAYTIETPNNTEVTTLDYQYYRNDNSWASLAGVADGTIVAGRPYAQNGAVTFDSPTDWARTTPTQASGSWFWTRFRRTPGVGNNFQISLYEVRVYAEIPTTDGVNMIMAYAPPTWVRAGYPATEAERYLVFDGQSVLAALIALCDQGGQSGGVAIREHFRLGAGREIDWLGTTLTPTGIRAVQSSDNPDADELCLITDLAVRHDASEIVTRIYPVSQDGIGLQLTSRAAPAGYTLNAASNYIEHDAGIAAYGRIERVMRFDDVSMQYPDSFLILPTLVANAVFDCSVEYLRTHAIEQAYYMLSLTNVAAVLAPGETIDVIYHDYVDGQHVVNIDDTLTILAATTRIDNDGVTTVALDVATADRQPQTDAGVVVDLVKRKDRAGASGAAIAIPAPPPEEITYQAGVDLILDGTTFHRAGNRVLLFSADGTQLAQFDADDDGLTAALAAMSDGDVVRLPPCSIGGAHTVPAGGTLEGCGEASVLTGQLTLEAGTRVRHLAIIRDEDDADEIIGVITGDESGDIAWLEDCAVQVTNATGDATGCYTDVVVLWRQDCFVWANAPNGIGYADKLGGASLWSEGGSAWGSTAPGA